MLAPGWTDYAQRIAYQTYDVTGLLRPGENVLGALLADGWYAGFVGFDAKRAGAHYGAAPEFLAQLVIEFADGSRARGSSPTASWQARFAAVRHADLLMGERHDLALEPHGWDAPGFDAAGWRPVRLPGPRRHAAGRRPGTAGPGDPGDRAGQRRPGTAPGGTSPTSARTCPAGCGSPWTARPAPACASGTARCWTADGSLYTENLRTARQTDEFLTSGGPEVLEPRFTLHGFRYAEISGYPGEPGPGDIVARVVHSDIPATGSFESSAPWLDQLFRNIDWGQRGNFISVPTDCPQRDERLGWLGDAQVFARTACYNRDVAAFFAKWLDDVADAQHAVRRVPRHRAAAQHPLGRGARLGRRRA